MKPDEVRSDKLGNLREQAEPLRGGVRSFHSPSLRSQIHPSVARSLSRAFVPPGPFLAPREDFALRNSGICRLKLGTILRCPAPNAADKQSNA
jgi:hypothetical protein